MFVEGSAKARDISLGINNVMRTIGIPVEGMRLGRKYDASSAQRDILYILKK
jgi:hypothetical protein